MKVLLVLAVLIVGLVLMVKYLPWWASVLILLGGVLSLKWIFRYLLYRLFLAPFKMKGKALAGAGVTVHGLTPAEPPVEEGDQAEEEKEEAVGAMADGEPAAGEEVADEAEEDEAGPSEPTYPPDLQWHYLDVTITPQPRSEGFTHWEPGELLLVGIDAKPDKLDEDDEAPAVIAECRIHRDGQFVPDEEGKYFGPQRLRLHVGVKPGVTALQFRYYFELFGRISLVVTPSGSSQQNAALPS